MCTRKHVCVYTHKQTHIYCICTYFPFGQSAAVGSLVTGPGAATSLWSLSPSATARLRGPPPRPPSAQHAACTAAQRGMKPRGREGCQGSCECHTCFVCALGEFKSLGFITLASPNSSRPPPCPTGERVSGLPATGHRCRQARSRRYQQTGLCRGPVAWAGCKGTAVGGGGVSAWLRGGYSRCGQCPGGDVPFRRGTAAAPLGAPCRGASWQKPPGLPRADPGAPPSSGDLSALVGCDLQVFGSDQCGLTPDAATPTPLAPPATSQDWRCGREDPTMTGTGFAASPAWRGHKPDS